MIFNVIGKKGKPVVVLIHGMYNNEKSVLPVAEYLKKDYYVIVPTLDGHYKGSRHFISKEREALKILRYLKKKNIREVALVQGVDLGAAVAMELARISDIPINHYFYDSGMFFKTRTQALEKMRKKAQRYVNMCYGKDKGKAYVSVMNDNRVKLMISSNSAVNTKIITNFVDTARYVSPVTVRNITDTCFNCTMPDFDQVTQRRMVFFYAKNDVAKKSKKRLKKLYPVADYRDLWGFEHAGFMYSNPEMYAAYLKNVINNVEK